MTVKACFLPHEAQLVLQGNKIPEFLQGQLTCDTRKLSESQAIPGALCNPKGRVITDLWVLELAADCLALRLRADIAENTAQILARYAQFSRITVSQPADTSILGIYSGDGATINELLPGDVGGLRLSQDCYWLRRGPRHGEIGALGPAGLEQLEALAAGFAAGEEAAWQAEDLLLGHFAIEGAESERFTPQALNYDLTDRVAFDKGCYTGQEVVARLHYKGQSKRRLAVLGAKTSVEDRKPENILDEQQAVRGTVLRTARDQDGQTLLATELLVDSGLILQTETGESLERIWTPPTAAPG